MFFIKAHNQKRKFSVVALVAILIQVFAPLQTFALTGGPSQSEYESFEPAGATEMVNLATGDFVYNIPLLDVDGYPINIAYHAGATMEQEATWVGLGWNLNVGSISRAMRGLPDEFNGDVVNEEINIKTNKTWGVDLGAGVELVGLDLNNWLNLGAGFQMGFGITYNNYKGLGLSVEMGVTGDLTATAGGASGSIGGGLGLKISNSDGADFTMNGSIGAGLGAYGISGSIGKNHMRALNSRQGLVGDIVSGSVGMGVSIKGVSYSTGTGQSINLIPNTAYLPNMEYSTKFMGITGELHLGGELYWCNIYGYVRGHYFEQGIDGNNYSRPAYGYLNLHNAGPDAMMDFNRDRDGTYYTESPKLPFATLTYDLYNTNAQGLNEVYRPYRNDFGHIRDNITTGGGSANDIGLEGNIGNLFEIGANDYAVETYNTSGDWYNGNNAVSAGNVFVGDNQLTNNGTNRYDAAYFKALDEMVIEDLGFLGSVGGDKVSQFEILDGGSPISTLNNSLIGLGTGSYSGQLRNANKRDVRANNFSFLNVTEAQSISPTNTSTNKNATVSFPLNTFSYTPDGEIDLTASGTNFLPRNLNIPNIDHHISEIHVIKDDGARYTYGIPVYNKTQKEEIFNASGLSITSDDVVDYTSGDNSLSNGNGFDNFYNKKELPPYAHSYLLTALHSKDYVDILGDGMTPDDFGDYTKFNYTQHTSNYEWRSPVTSTPMQALYEPAMRADDKDDKGALVTGSKELWYVHSIETKNYVAEFHLSDRLDGQGVDAQGNILSNPSNTPQRLDKIVLYCKHNLSKPVKTVFFEYDYSLCPGTPNSAGSGGAKLTLKRVFFSYGTSDKGVFNPYEFTYASGANNPSYDRRFLDRWGYHQTTTGVFTNNNKDFPYTSQDTSIVNANARAWTLTSIVTPAKSQINVAYEADSYAFIQDKTPGQMITMMEFHANDPGSGHSPTIPTLNTMENLYSTGGQPYAPNNWMVVDLSLFNGGGIEAPSQAAADAIFRNKVLPLTNQNGKDQLYFRGLVKVGNTGSSLDEMIPGYAEFDRGASHVLTSSLINLPNGNDVFKFAVIKLKEVDIEDPKNYAGDDCNPISKAGWQITRLQHPQIAYPGSQPGGNVLTALGGLWAAFTEVFTFKQKNNRLRKKGFSAKIYPASSTLRVNVPTRTKYGGGHRVTKIEILDNWNNSVGSEASTTYGQTYDYSIKDNNDIITSGVTSYEPFVGGDENSLREPIEYSVARIAAPDDAHFSERPVGESFFPPPTVIYSKITIRNLDRRDASNNLMTQNLGRTEYQFYTSKDFPISSNMGGLQNVTYLPGATGDLFDPSIESSVYVSQGFILKLNNMHGRLKSVLVFQEGNNLPISGTKYFYKTGTNKKVLNNTINVMDANGSIGSKLVGQHLEVVSDMRSSSSVTFGKTFRLNLNVSFLTPIPIPIPIPSWFNGASSETRDFYSSTVNKIVTQNGILNKIETIDNYATSSTEYLVWDGITHEPILSKTTTKFKDFDYNYTTSAYWIYKGMGGAFQNIGYGFKNKVNTVNGTITLGNGLLKDGDEVELIYTDITTDQFKRIFEDRLWITKVGTSLKLIDREGRTCGTAAGNHNVFTDPTVVPSGANNFVLKVIRSGYRNNLTETAEEINFLSNPNGSGGINKSNNVLDASASEFSEDWPTYCSYSDVTCNNTGFNSTNPYILNSKGNWNEKRSYSYLTERVEKNSSNIYDIRTAGTFTSFVPFFEGVVPVYDPARATYTASAPFNKWVLNSEITQVNSNGFSVEAKDGVNRFSSVLYGYNQTLKTASASNARLREIGNDNFENRYFQGYCLDKHFYLHGNYSVTNTTAHTGRYSGVLAYENVLYYDLVPTTLNCEVPYGSNNVYLDPATSATTSGIYGYSTTPCTNCISGVSPMASWPKEQKYIFSVWFKEQSLNANGTYTIPQVLILAGPATITQISKSSIIEGWQKFDYEIRIQPNSTSSVKLGMQNLNVGSTVYFDDVRLHPFNADMSTYVYDTKTLRLWAELDENNFATFYTYNNEGVLVGTKKETDRGIMSIKDSRSSVKKN